VIWVLRVLSILGVMEGVAEKTIRKC
jgi:hypothetical protein